MCPRSPLLQGSCFDAVGNTSACFTAIKDLNSKGANFAWPPVKVNCENETWFRPDDEDNVLGNNLGRIHNSFAKPEVRLVNGPPGKAV